MYLPSLGTTMETTESWRRSALSSLNRFMIWNERDSPRPAMRRGAIPVMSCPANRTLPRSGLKRPVSTLKQVVLPAPFGPIRPDGRPSSKASETSCSTTWSPKRLCR